MTSGRRYFFVAADTNVPSGGRQYIYTAVSILRDLGYDARVLHASAGFSYTWFEHDVPVAFIRPSSLWSGQAKHLPRDIVRFVRRSFKAWSFRVRADTRPVQLTADDVVVLPETDIATQKYYGDVKIVIFNQNGFYLADVLALRGGVPGGLLAVVSTSVLSDAYARSFDMPNCRAVPYVIEAEAFAYQSEKQRQIAYMPRKRGREAGKIAQLLELRGRLDGFELVAIDGVSKEDAARLISQSLIFISLSEREGFGLPPAEAMATGSIVVGYTGHGGREFFTADTGIVLEDGDMLGVVEAVEAVIAEYGRDPVGVDARRAAASKFIHQRYSQAAAVAAFEAVWGEIDSLADEGARSRRDQ